MDETSLLIYNELVALRNDFKVYMDSMDKRVSALEAFKNKIAGILIAIGVASKFVWDYITERIV